MRIDRHLVDTRCLRWPGGIVRRRVDHRTRNPPRSLWRCRRRCLLRSTTRQDQQEQAEHHTGGGHDHGRTTEIVDPIVGVASKRCDHGEIVTRDGQRVLAWFGDLDPLDGTTVESVDVVADRVVIVHVAGGQITEELDIERGGRVGDRLAPAVGDVAGCADLFVHVERSGLGEVQSRRAADRRAGEAVDRLCRAPFRDHVQHSRADQPGEEQKQPERRRNTPTL